MASVTVTLCADTSGTVGHDEDAKPAFTSDVIGYVSLGGRPTGDADLDAVLNLPVGHNTALSKLGDAIEHLTNRVDARIHRLEAEIEELDERLGK